MTLVIPDEQVSALDFTPKAPAIRAQFALYVTALGISAYDPPIRRVAQRNALLHGYPFSRGGPDAVLPTQLWLVRKLDLGAIACF